MKKQIVCALIMLVFISSNARKMSNSQKNIVIEWLHIIHQNRKLTNQMVPTIERVLGKKNVEFIDPVTLAEDFSYFQLKIPGFYFFLGGTPLNIAEPDAPSHHTPKFFVNDSVLEYGVNILTAMVKDYLKNK